MPLERAGLTPKVVVERGGHAPTADEPLPAAVEHHSRNPILRIIDRFGTNAPKSSEERREDVAYRADREKELEARFPSLVESKEPFDQVIREAHKALNEAKPLSVLVRLGAFVMGNNFAAGAYRTAVNRAGQYLAPRATDVPTIMEAFGSAMGRLSPRDDEGALLTAAWAFTMMIRTHPFADGNGRTARASMNLVLARAQQKTIDFPVDSEGVYKKSAVWLRLKDHMREFVGPSQLGWTMDEGIVPPRGYHEKLKQLLVNEAGAVTLESLRARPDIVAIADALRDAREHGFG